jgi:hypothetical protein
MGLLLLLQVVLVAAAAMAPAAEAWGKEGHYMTCKIADVSINTMFVCLLSLTISTLVSMI